jgi:hypothetical protein
MQRIPGTRNNATVQTSLAVCHSFPDFRQTYEQVTAKFGEG